MFLKINERPTYPAFLICISFRSPTRNACRIRRKTAQNGGFPGRGGRGEGVPSKGFSVRPLSARSGLGEANFFLFTRSGPLRTHPNAIARQDRRSGRTHIESRRFVLG